MSQDLSEGQIVELKSGGPKMTVIAIDGTEAVCRWFAGNSLKEQRFALITIRPHEPPSDPTSLAEAIREARRRSGRATDEPEGREMKHAL